MYDHLRANVLKNKEKKEKVEKSEKITQNHYLATLYFHNPLPLIFMFFYIFLRIALRENLLTDLQIVGTITFRKLNTFHIIYQKL